MITSVRGDVPGRVKGNVKTMVVGPGAGVHRVKCAVRIKKLWLRKEPVDRLGEDPLNGPRVGTETEVIGTEAEKDQGMYDVCIMYILYFYSSIIMLLSKFMNSKSRC